MGKFYAMSLSILIPTYNYDCSTLVKELRTQAESLGREYEIIVGDDGSTDGKIVNKLIDTCSMPFCRLLRVKRNVGRASIRNRLGHEAHYENLLFIDSDAKIVVDNFLSSYLDAIKTHEIVSGFISHAPEAPSADMMLRYEYEKSFGKAFSAEKLNAIPHPPFATFCFMIRRNIFLQHQFDETFTDYGYEDTLYGKTLREAGHKTYYISTPLQHNGMEKNAKFVEKTEAALRTLKKHEKELLKDVHLLRVVHKLHNCGLTGLVRLCLKPFLNKMRNNLCSDHANLKWLNYYKLGYYLELKA